MADKERYEWITAIVDYDGDGVRSLRWEYRVVGSFVTRRDSYDLDVSDYTEKDIRKLTCEYLNVTPDQTHCVKVEYA